MLFVITAHDRPGALEQRQKVRPDHLAYLERASGRIKVGGPLLDGDDQPVGSLLIVEAEDQAAAEALVADDPYRKEGVFGEVTVQPFRAVLGAWAG